MASRAKSSNFSTWIARAFLQLIMILLIVSMLIYIINIAGTWAMHWWNPRCNRINNLYSYITTKDYIYMGLMLVGIVVIKKTL